MVPYSWAVRSNACLAGKDGGFSTGLPTVFVDNFQISGCSPGVSMPAAERGERAAVVQGATGQSAAQGAGQGLNEARTGCEARVYVSRRGACEICGA